ncbi:hypothetical protein EMCRGX_G006255 [Ephydatia muelleri]
MKKKQNVVSGHRFIGGVIGDKDSQKSYIHGLGVLDPTSMPTCLAGLGVLDPTSMPTCLAGLGVLDPTSMPTEIFKTSKQGTVVA